MSPKLFVSFWDLCLDNLPDGVISKRVIQASEARALIAAARSRGALMGVSAEDLAAPYNERELQKHLEFCSVLSSEHDIAIGIDDFRGDDFFNPLQFARVTESESLLVISCSYAMDAETRAPVDDREAEDFEWPRFSIAPDTISFHLVETVV